MKKRFVFLIFAGILFTLENGMAQKTESREGFPSSLENLAALDNPGELGASSYFSTRSQSIQFEESFSYNLEGYWCEGLDFGDFNNDGSTDLLMVLTTTPDTTPPYSYNSKVVTLQKSEDWNYVEKVVATYNSYGYTVSTGDFNNDSWEDFALMAAGKTRIFLNGQNGDFYESWSGGSGYACLDLNDINGDGQLDFVQGVQNSGSTPGTIKAFLNSGLGHNFTQSWESGFYGDQYGTIHDLISIDLNQDGFLDLVGTEIYDGLLFTLSGDGTGENFREETLIQYLSNNRVFGLAVGNVNGDGKPDVATYVGWGGAIVYETNDVDSLTEVWVSPNLFEAAFNLALEDFTGDGLDDLFIGMFSSGRLLVYENTGNNDFELLWEGAVPEKGYVGEVADFDNDGMLDLVVGGEDNIRIWRRQTVSNTPENSATPLILSSIKTYPNPFNESVTIAFSLPGQQHVRVEAFNLAGLPVATLADRPFSAGNHSLNWHPEGLPAGLYLCRLVFADGIVSRILNYNN